MALKGADDEDEYDITQVVTYEKREEPAEETDPFTKAAAEVWGLADVSTNRKRKITTMQKRYEGTEDAGSKRIEDDVITGYNAFEVVHPPHNQDYLARLYSKSPDNYAAINAKVSNIVGLGYDFVESNLTKRKLDEEEDKEKVAKLRKKLMRTKNDLMDKIDSFNKEDTFAETLANVWKDYEATGNGYLEIGRKDNGEIGYIGHIPCVSIRVRRKRDGFVQIIANKAVFFRNFGEVDPNPITKDQSPNEIIHIKKYNPISTYYGVPDIVAAIQAVAGNDFVARFNLDFFENKAVPRHVVILKGGTIAPALAKNLLEFFETGLKGKNHRSMFVPLPAETDGKKVELQFEAIDAKVQESSFKTYQSDNRNTIFMAHRTPPSKTGLSTSGMSLAAARDADKTFKEQVCQPEQKIFEKKLNRIIGELTDLLVLKLNELTLTDENTQSQIDERRIKTGVDLPNEQRAKRGLPPISGGDKRVDLNAKGGNTPGAENRAAGNRERDAQRSAAATDSQGEGRNTQGEGRTNGTS